MITNIQKLWETRKVFEVNTSRETFLQFLVIPRQTHPSCLHPLFLFYHLLIKEQLRRIIENFVKRNLLPITVIDQLPRVK
jgi:hypothetical protein